MNVYILTFLKCLLPIPPPSKISILKRIPGPLGTFLITFIFTQIYSYCSQQFCKIISSLSAVMGEKKILFSWPNTDIIILMSSWDIAFLVERLHWFELVAIRFLLIFFNSNTWYWDEKKAKLTKFIELAILEFGCPKRTHNTNSTRFPLLFMLVALLWYFLCFWGIFVLL